jgi:hypothetical protein
VTFSGFNRPFDRTAGAKKSPPKDDVASEALAFSQERLLNQQPTLEVDRMKLLAVP